jgi:hypothetical protein
MGVGHHWDWEATDGTEADSLRVEGYLGKVALDAVIVGVLWECTVGALVFHLLDPPAEQAWSALVFKLHCLGHCSVPFHWHKIAPT